LYHILAVLAGVVLTLLLLAGPLFTVALENALERFPLAPASTQPASLLSALPALGPWGRACAAHVCSRGLPILVSEHLNAFFGPATIVRAWATAWPGLRFELTEELPALLAGRPLPQPKDAPVQWRARSPVTDCKLTNARAVSAAFTYVCTLLGFYNRFYFYLLFTQA
jgi:hypothetical protein